MNIKKVCKVKELLTACKTKNEYFLLVGKDWFEVAEFCCDILDPTARVGMTLNWIEEEKNNGGGALVTCGRRIDLFGRRRKAN